MRFSGYFITGFLTLSFCAHWQDGHAQTNAPAISREKSGEDDFATFKIGPTSVLSEAVVPLIEMARRSSKFDYDFLEHNANTYFIYRGWVE